MSRIIICVELEFQGVQEHEARAEADILLRYDIPRISADVVRVRSVNIIHEDGS